MKLKRDCGGLLLSSTALNAEQIAALKTQLEIFNGIGEISQLPGFQAIAQASLTALKVNPTAVQAIAPLVQVNFRAAQSAILEGDRTHGGSPSSELLDWTQPHSADLPLPALPSSDRAISSDQPVPSPRSVPSTRPDWTRLDLLSNLVSELTTQTNRSLFLRPAARRNPASASAILRSLPTAHPVAASLGKSTDPRNTDQSQDLA